MTGQHATKTLENNGFSQPCTQDHSILPTRHHETSREVTGHSGTVKITDIPEVSDSRLKAILDAWEHLPEAIKAGMAAMAKASEQRLT
jgi:hypothetical protein